MSVEALNSLTEEEILDAADEIEAKREREAKRWHMYEAPGCSKCGYNGYTRYEGSGYAAYVSVSRCDCSRVHTEQYLKDKENKDISVREYEKIMSNYVDNNFDKCKSWDNSRDD